MQEGRLSPSLDPQHTAGVHQSGPSGGWGEEGTSMAGGEGPSPHNARGKVAPKTGGDLPMFAGPRHPPLDGQRDGGRHLDLESFNK